MQRAFVVVALVALLLAPASAAAPPNPADLEAELVCPTCKTTLDQSSAPVANRMKAIIRERIAAGASAAEIKAELVDQFGPAVLAEPEKKGFDLLAWGLPLVGIAIGMAGVAALAWAWSSRGAAGADPDPALDAELDRRVDEELARWES
jgi:cytochrome c-type biogenesis protein CcmH